MKKITAGILCFALFIVQIYFAENQFVGAQTWHEISNFSTEYKFSVSERKHNIALSASKLDGIILQSGERLSFNKVVGNRTQENGYKMSTVIENGVYTGGVGGGVCQTSTTLYNAVLRAGLKVLEVHPHSLSPEYVDASFDAMVSSEGSDFVFRNIYPYPIKIFASANGEVLTIKIFATKKIQGLEIIPYSDIVKIMTPPEAIEKLDTEVEGTSVPCGETVVFRNSKVGKVSKGYIMYKYNKKVIRIKQIRNDVYIPIQGINIIGTTKNDLHS